MTFEKRFRQLYADLARININDLSLVYHQDIEFVDPVTTHRGIEAVKGYFANLLESVDSCQFNIHSLLNTGDSGQSGYSHVVEWTMLLQLKNKPGTISVDGVSMLKVRDDKIHYHRDYYDLGEMVYEHVPVLRSVIGFIKKKLDS